MCLIRFLLVITVALSTSLSGAMDASHTATVKHDQAAMEELVDDQPICCLETTEHTQTCHALLALLPGTGLFEAAPASSEDVIIGPGLLMTGIKPSGPLDPPRLV
ncbi:MAG: hypothetical protein ACSHW1_12100 [Yoonia sp.]|uniref:hypothetical protein n=1 Tax=unclassified Yoonia TaxID=2629118 RepID=UPI001EDF0D09|nr:hypothetical protein [Yoonia sp. I 8.24]MCG3269594.1 hypothetical protein [Yoonia sp. I 8.24]